MNVTLYSTNCPKCMVLEKKLTIKKIPYEVNTSVDEMEKLGIMSVPVLKVDDELLDFPNAVAWVDKT